MEAMDKLKKDLEEVKKLHALATRQRVKDVLSIEQYKIEAEILNTEVKQRVTADNKPPTPSAIKYHTELQEYGWDQSEKFVKIFITIPDVHSLPEDSVTAEFTKTSLLVRIQNLNNKNYSLTIKELHSPIDTVKSYKKIKTDMVAIYMKKLEENQKWSHLSLTEKRVSQLKDSTIKDDGNDFKDDDPSSGIINLMKKMYESGDTETKKMIAKAWTESQEKQKQMNF